MAAGLRFSSLDHTVGHNWSEPPVDIIWALGTKEGMGEVCPGPS